MASSLPTSLKKSKPRVAFATLGCRANQYDTGALGSELKETCDIVAFDEQADIYIINSCAITLDAERSTSGLVRKFRRLNPRAKTVVTGCAAQVNPKRYQEPGVVVVGHNAKEKIAELIATVDVAQSLVSKHRKDDSVYFKGGVRLDGRSRGFLKIQDGCSQFCSFCIVPFARGLNRSVDPDKIMESLHELHAEGIEEVVLTGIHLGTYGHDLKPKTTLASLLARMALDKPVARIRLSSIDPEEFSDELLEIVSDPFFCRHFHLPLQSGDDGVLRRMRRRYVAADFLKLAEKMARVIPSVCIGTDVIVGFPGESEEAYAATRQVIAESAVSTVHVFPYSPRAGTKAALFEDTVEAAEKKKRVRDLRALSQKKYLEFCQSQVGNVFPAIIERQGAGFAAMTDHYILADLQDDPQVPPGTIVPVRLQNLEGSTVKATVCLPPTPRHREIAHALVL